MIENPYNPLEPAARPDYFYGRGDVFGFFRQNLVGTPHERALVLIGRRGLGKSSVLYQLDHQLDDRYRTCVVSLGAHDLSSEEGLIGGLIEEIRQTLDQAEVSTYRLPDWPPAPDEETPLDLREWFNTVYLDIAMTALRMRHLLLALDDAHLLLEAIDRGDLPGDLLAYLETVLVTHARLDMVFVLDAAFEDRALIIPLLNDPTLHVRLAELAPDEAERLVVEPVQDAYTYDADVAGQIRVLADGHPFLLHSVCRLLFRRSEERNHAGPVTGHDLDAVQPAVLEQADEIFSPLWNGATQNERATLAALVEGGPATFEALYDHLTAAGYTLNKTQLAAALRSLDYKGLAQVDSEGQHSIPAGLIAAWITATSAPAVSAEAPPRRARAGRLAPVLGLIAVIALVGGLGAAALFGLFESDGNESSGGSSGAPTATLSLKLEETRQSDFATQTEQAKPSHTPQPTATPTDTMTPTATQTPSNTPLPTSTPTRTPTQTRTATASPTDRPGRTATADLTGTYYNELFCATPDAGTRTPTPRTPVTNTPRPPTLDPGG